MLVFKYNFKFTNGTHKIVRFSEKNNRSFWSIYLRNYTCIACTCLIIIFNHCKAIFSGFETKNHYLDAKKWLFLHSVQKNNFVEWYFFRYGFSAMWAMCYAKADEYIY